MLKLTRLFLADQAARDSVTMRSCNMELFELIQTFNTAHGPSGDEGRCGRPSPAWPALRRRGERRIPLGT